MTKLLLGAANIAQSVPGRSSQVSKSGELAGGNWEDKRKGNETGTARSQKTFTWQRLSSDEGRAQERDRGMEGTSHSSLCRIRN